MKLIVPSYYKDFQCLADKCKDCCCKCWEIDIDKKTEEYYKKVPGKFGKKLKENIIFNNPASFKLKENNECPFLSPNKLCEIYINLGENKMCDICKEHPRYYEWFNNFKEGGIGMCCEEAARLILTSSPPFTTIELKTLDIENEDNYSKKLYDFLNKERIQLINYIQNNNDINIKMISLLNYADQLQENLTKVSETPYIPFTINEIHTKTQSKIENLKHNKNYEDFFSFTLYGCLLNILTKNQKNFKESIKKIINYYSKLPPLQKKWQNNLKEYLNYINKYKTNIFENYKIFEKAIPKNYLENITTYFIWRYFIKTTFDRDVIQKIYLTVLSTTTIKLLMFFEWEKNKNISLDNWILICKYYSEEIEYSDENLIKIDDTFLYDELL